jgi:hypothetical protein
MPRPFTIPDFEFVKQKSATRFQEQFLKKCGASASHYGLGVPPEGVALLYMDSSYHKKKSYAITENTFYNGAQEGTHGKRNPHIRFGKKNAKDDQGVEQTGVESCFFIRGRSGIQTGQDRLPGMFVSPLGVTG